MSAKGIRAGKAFVEIGADSAPLDAALQRLRGRLQDFGKALATAGAGMIGLGASVLGPMLAAARSFAAAGDQLSKMGIKVGVSAEQLSRLKFIAEQSGVSLETLTGGMFRLTRVIQGAALNGGAAAEALEQLGLNAANVAALSPEQQLQTLAGALSNVSDAGMRSFLAYQLLGIRAREMMPLLGLNAEGFEELGRRAEELGGVMSDADALGAVNLTDAMHELQTAITGVWRRIGASIAPVLNSIFRQVATVVGMVSQWLDQNRQLVVAVAAVASVVVGLGAVLVAVGAGFMGVSIGIGLITSKAAMMTAGAIAAGAALATWPGILTTIQEGAAAVFASLGDLSDFAGTFEGLGQTMRDTWKSVVDAVASGDLSAAFDVAAAGVNLGWAQVTDGMRDRWYSVTDTILDAWTDATHGLAIMGSQAVFTVMGFFEQLRDGALNIFGELRDYWDSLWGEAGEGPTENQRSRARRGLASAERGQERERYLQQLVQMATEEKANRRAGRTQEATAAQQGLAAAQERFAEVRDQIAAAAAAPPDKADEIADAAAAASGTGSAIVGQFNATLAGQQLGIKDLQSRTAKASEKTARNTEKMVMALATTGVLIGS